MKLFVPVSVMFLLLLCVDGGPGSMYEGPPTNGKCALEVFPPKLQDQVKKADSARKEDPLIRQNGLSVCRTF